MTQLPELEAWAIAYQHLHGIDPFVAARIIEAARRAEDPYHVPLAHAARYIPPGLTWRSPLDPTGAYRFAKWVRDLSNRAGVYLIRAGAGFADELLYIGESTRHDDGAREFRGLYRTLTRHLQPPWKAGTAYDPESVVVAVVLLKPEGAVETQDNLIALLQPRDNRDVRELRLFGYTSRVDEDVPF